MNNPAVSPHFGGAGARARGHENRQKVLRWLHRWCVIDALVTRALLGVQMDTAERILRRIRDQGLIRRVHHPMVAVYMLTAAGARASRAAQISAPLYAVNGVTAITEPSRVPTQRISHDLIAQLSLLASVQTQHEQVRRTWCDREVRGDTDEVRELVPLMHGIVPDAMATMGDGTAVIVEAQLSYQRSPSLDYRMWRYGRIHAARAERGLCMRLIYACGTEAIRSRILDAAASHHRWGHERHSTARGDVITPYRLRDRHGAFLRANHDGLCESIEVRSIRTWMMRRYFGPTT